MGFLIGSSSTPNRVPLELQYDGDPMLKTTLCPAGTESSRVPVLLRFGHRDGVRPSRPRSIIDAWHPTALGDELPPFHVVDDEIYRFLPTVIVGTPDKIASVSIQAARPTLWSTPSTLF